MHYHNSIRVHLTVIYFCLLNSFQSLFTKYIKTKHNQGRNLKVSHIGLEDNSNFKNTNFFFDY